MPRFAPTLLTFRILPVLLLSGQVQAGSELLDPRSLPATREAVSPVMPVPGQLGLPAAHPASTRAHTPTHARRMAESVVKSLDHLTRQTVGLMDAMAARGASAPMTDAVPRGGGDSLQHQYEAAVEQIGQGLNLWRTSIAFERRLLAQEETAALAAKDLERVRADEQLRLLTLERDSARQQALDRQAVLTSHLTSISTRIDRLAGEQAATEAALRDNRQKLAKLVLLMPTATGSPGETGLLREQARLESEFTSLSKTRLTQLAEQDAQSRLLAENRTAMEESRNPPAVHRLDRELALWQDTLDTIDRQRSEIRRNSRSALARAEATADDEQKQLAEFLRRGQLAGIARVADLSGPHAPGTGFFDLGGLYRMGDFSTAHRNEELPDVNAFVVAFMNGAPNNPTRYDQDKRS